LSKKSFIEDLREGERIDELFMVKQVRHGETRAGKPYLHLTLGDKSGETGAPVWDNSEAVTPHCRLGAVIRVRGMVQSYRDTLQLKVESIEPVEDQQVDLHHFIPVSSRTPDDMAHELRTVIEKVANRFLRLLLQDIFFGTETGAQFVAAPAAKGLHHAYQGGLLEHTLSMVKVASMLADHYPGVDGDLLIAGVLLHDVGKTVELDAVAGAVEYSDTGRLKGHLLIGCEIITAAAAAIADFPGELLIHLHHLVLSHHGRLEFGSPVVPMTPEALLLSFIDDVDAKMNRFEQLRRKLKTGTPQWSDYQRSMERYLYLTPLDGNADLEQSKEKPVQSLRQPRLFG
jgi:3'-5' exoribonuclease